MCIRDRTKRSLTSYFLPLLLCGLLGCTTAARQAANATTAPATTLVPTAVIAQADTPPAATATATRLAPSRTPRPTAVGNDGSTSPLQPEATATATATPPTPSPTPTPVPTSSVVPGWITYENKFLGYSFSYPLEATIDHHGVTGFDVEELPKNLTPEQYLAHLESIYPADLCVGVGYKTGFVTVGPADEPLSGYASPCGITGIGDYTIEEWEEVVTINGQSYTANAMRLYLWQTDQLEHEYYLLRDFNNDLNIDFGLSMRGAPRSGQQDLTEAEFNKLRETLLQILASFRFFPPQIDGE